MGEKIFLFDGTDSEIVLQIEIIKISERKWRDS